MKLGVFDSVRGSGSGIGVLLGLGLDWTGLGDGGLGRVGMFVLLGFSMALVESILD